MAVNFVILGRDGGKNVVGPPTGDGNQSWNGTWKALLSDEELASVRAGESELVPADSQETEASGYAYVAKPKTP